MKKLIAVLCLVLFALSVNAQTPAPGATGRAVTQTGTITSPVSINTEIGVITTVSTTLAGAGVTSFTVNDSAVTPTSTVISDVQGYSGTLGTNGFPTIMITGITTGSFVINIANVHGSNALSGTLNIGFMIK